MIIVKALFVAVGLAGAVGICCWNHSLDLSLENSVSTAGCCASFVPAPEPPPSSARAGCCAAPVKVQAPASAAPLESADQQEPPLAPATVVLNVDGMTCAACANAVQAAIENVPGVDGARVSFAQKKAEVALTDGISVLALIDAVQKAGFSASEGSSGDD